MSERNKINWTNTLFLTITPIVGIVGTILLSIYTQIHWATWVLAISLYWLSGTAISAGYHRLFSHCALKSSWIVRLLLLLFGAATFEGDVLEWATDHRNHHMYVDTNKDPYNINNGFWYAHFGWLIRLDPSKRDFSNVADLQKDPLIRFQTRHYKLVAIFMGFVLPTLIGALWGNALAGFIIAGALRITVVHHCTFFINSLCHTLGSRPYSDKHTARDHWFTAILTFGEGYHNFHHQFPLDYRNGVRWYHFDTTKWMLNILAYCGLVSDFKRVSPQLRVKYRMRNKLSQLSFSNTEIGVKVKAMYDGILEKISHLDELEKTYAKLKTRDYRLQIKNAQRELKSMLATWIKLTRSPTMSPTE